MRIQLVHDHSDSDQLATAPHDDLFTALLDDAPASSASSGIDLVAMCSPSTSHKHCGRVLALSLIVLAATTGCIPVPLLVPPTKVDLGAAVKGSDEGITATFPIRAGLHLLQLNEFGYFRRFDVAPGWSIFPAINGEFLHGPFLEGGLLFPIEDGPRWGTNLKIHYLFPSEEKPHGIATSIQGTVEWADWSDGIFGECDTDDGCSAGVSYGEASIGFFLEMSVAHFPGDRRQFWAGGGILFRIPLTVGLVFVPIWELDN